MTTHRACFAFPQISDRLAVELNDLIELFYADFQSHYYAQIRRYYHERARDCAPEEHRQIPLPLEDTRDLPF